MKRVPEETVTWPPKRAPEVPPWPTPSLLRHVMNGTRGRCPACGNARLFSGYIRVVPKCPKCGAPLGEIPVESAPAYLTLVIVALLVIGTLVILDATIAPSTTIEAAVLLPLTLVLTVLLLRPTKGAAIGLLLGLGVTKAP